MYSVNIMAVSIQDYEISCVKSSLWPLISEEKTVKHLNWKEVCFLWNMIWMMRYLVYKVDKCRKISSSFMVREARIINFILIMVFCPIKVRISLKNS